MTEQKMQNIKIALIGDCGVGKTSISVRYTRNEFKNEYVSTSGASYSIKKVEKFFNSGNSEDIIIPNDSDISE